MMSQPIKISDQSKKKIERIQSQLRLDHNIKITQIEIIDILLTISEKDANLLEQIKRTKFIRKQTDQERAWNELLQHPPDWTESDLSHDIDEWINRG